MAQAAGEWVRSWQLCDRVAQVAVNCRRLCPPLQLCVVRRVAVFAVVPVGGGPLVVAMVRCVQWSVGLVQNVVVIG